VIWAWNIRDTLQGNFFVSNFAPGSNQAVLTNNNAPNLRDSQLDERDLGYLPLIRVISIDGEIPK
jgi:hypothetical protein